ncbi:MAG TPA: FtsX-like permease family protein [Gammaproteobacteria bacterium]|nr:FtsX-like permease family protein [Gammaproteobacteria bacterium]
MFFRDFIRLTVSAVAAQRLRSLLTGLGIAVGIAAVVLLTSIGEGIRQYVLSEFTQFGTRLVMINPGRTVTLGTPLGILGTVRPLSLQDAAALEKLPETRGVVAATQGNAEVEYGPRRRRVTVYGVGPALPEVFRMDVASGRFLPPDKLDTPRAFAVLGSKARSELFGTANPLGKRIRVGGARYRVIGVMESKGQMLGIDMDDAIYIPTARAMDLFNRESLMEIDVLYAPETEVNDVVAAIKRTLTARHGREDFTITTQEQMLDVLGSVLGVLTFAVGALGGISLAVGAVGILTVMTITVSERTGEIGLLRALGARRGQVLGLFLGEAMVLAALGGAAGLALGMGGAQVLHWAIPALPVHTPMWYVLLAETLATAIGLIAGVAPAQRAARMNPLEALRAE